jgi:hypothetical protein
VKKEVFDKLFQSIVEELKATRDEGQKEYAHDEDNVFANFERVGNNLDISREKTLMVYLSKHIDGINAWVKGHKSQREDVTGRIKDAIVYLCLLWGMTKPQATQNKSVFNPETGEVKYIEQRTGDEVL